MILKWALREILRNWRLSLFFILNVTLGLTGYISIEAFKDSLQKYLQQNSKVLLSADIAVSARRHLTESEMSLSRKMALQSAEAKESQVFEFFAMLRTQKGSRLVLVKAIDDLYPLYGQILLKQGGTISSESSKEILSQKGFWAYPELQQQMQLEVGEKAQLGQLDLTMNDFVLEDSTQTFRAATLAPRIFIHRNLLESSGLIQVGSTFTQSLLFKIPSSVDPLKLQQNLLASLSDPAVQVDTPKTAGEDAGRQIGYLSDYLGLVALVSLFLSGLGIAYIYQLFLGQRLKEIAIFRSLGLLAQQSVYLYLLQASILGLVALIPSYLLAQILLPLLSQIIASVTPFPLIATIPISSLILGAAISVVMSLFICWPMIIQIKKLNPAQLLREESSQFEISSAKFILYLPALALAYGLSIYQAHSFKIGSLFFGGVILVTIVLTLLGRVGLWLMEKINVQTPWPLKYALLSLTRKKTTSLAIFITLGVGTLLINLLPQIKTSLKSDLSFQDGSTLPALFLFDIQDEQLEPIQKFLAEKKLQFRTTSPMVRARILKINGVDYERKEESKTYRTREEEVEARSRNRGVNLSYRKHLSDSEMIVDGRPFSKTRDPSRAWAELSVEYRFAERLNLKIGDQILFDVQGVEVLGQIINLRRVKWTSFQPNFFILFEDGFLNEAPKTHIGILNFMPEAQKQNLIASSSQKFPNISMIDVSRLIQNVISMAEQMSWSLELMSALAFLTGYIVLYSIVRSQTRIRRWELNMLKILGSDPWSLSFYLQTEFLVLSVSASVLGVCLSYLVSGLLMKSIFDSPFVFSLGWTVISLLAVPILSAFVCFWASRKVIYEKPLVLLREA